MPVSTLDSSPFASHSAVDPLASSLFAPPPPSSSRGPLHPGAVWEGLQRSGRNSYKVRVNIDTVDLHQGTVSGLLQIQHLTPELESLVTFFEGEIIGDKAGFRTARWGATEADDMKHWSRFPAFSKSLRSSLLKPNLNFKHLNKPYLFMRWKEQFVVPSSHAQNIHGASFAGFYYLCLDFDSGPDDLPSPSAFPSRANDRERECTLSPPASRLGAPSRSLSNGSSGGRSRPPLRSPPIPSGGIGLGVGGSINEEREQSSSSEGLAIPMGTGSRSRSHSTNAVPTATSGSSTSTSPPVAPPRPRRASSASGFSYAAVVRGAGSPVSPPITPLPPPDSLGATADSTTPQRLPGFAPSHLLHPPPSPSSISHTPEASTPKEGAQYPTQGFDFNFSSLSLSLGLGAGASGEEQASPSSSTSTSHLPSSSSTLTDPSIPNIPIPSPSLPTPLGTSIDEFPVPSSPPPSAAMMRRRSSEGAGPSASGAGQGWDSPYPTRPPSASRRRSSFTNRSSQQREEYGLHSYSNAKMTGFYFFKHSEPYQELSLRYVPSTRRGGSDCFEFR